MYALRCLLHVVALDARKVMIILDVTSAFLHIRINEEIVVRPPDVEDGGWLCALEVASAAFGRLRSYSRTTWSTGTSAEL